MTTTGKEQEHQQEPQGNPQEPQEHPQDPKDQPQDPQVQLHYYQFLQVSLGHRKTNLVARS